MIKELECKISDYKFGLKALQNIGQENCEASHKLRGALTATENIFKMFKEKENEKTKTTLDDRCYRIDNSTSNGGDKPK